MTHRLDLAEVAALLPDLPQWIEVRSMLLHGKARIIGPVGASPPTFVALYQDGDPAAVVGRAAPGSIRDAAATASEILAAGEDTPWVADALPGWKYETALLFRRATGASLPDIARGQFRFLGPTELAAITDATIKCAELSLVPEDLRAELGAAVRAGVPIAASFDGPHAAAFCYAGSITETLWDVSIDTLEPYQRRGHALRAVSFLIEHYRGLGKEPVWGAYVSNHPSRALAARLGFEQVGTLSVFSAPRGGDT